METKWLEDFPSLARTLNFSRSADERFITQPAFSRRIKALEVWAGTPLVDRDTYPIELTKAGLAFKEVAEDALRCLYNGRDGLGTLGDSSGETITVCAGHALLLAFIPQWLLSVHEKLGPVEISMRNKATINSGSGVGSHKAPIILEMVARNDCRKVTTVNKG